jgi:glycosyltransferase involved in cell wall biosynthesis
VANEPRPLITVIITCYNIQQYVEAALRSVLNQSYGFVEIIVVDDGSSDNTEAVVRPYLSDGRVSFLRKENGGPSSARNHGIQRAQGEFIAFLDGDDVWEPDKLELQAEALLNNPSAGMVFSDFSTFDSSGSFVTCKNKSLFKELEPVQYGFLVSRNNFIYPSTVVVRKKCFEVCGVFDETLRGIEDWELWLRITRHFHILGLHPPLAGIRQHLSNISANVPAMLLTERRAIDMQIPYLSKLDYRKRVARLYYLNADRSVHNGNRTQAFRLLLKGVQSYPQILPIGIVVTKMVLGGTTIEALRRGIDEKPIFRRLFELIYKRY